MRELLPRVLTSLMRDIGIPNGIGAAGYASGGIPALAGATLKQRRLLASCPRPVTGDDLGRISNGPWNCGDPRDWLTWRPRSRRCGRS